MRYSRALWPLAFGVVFAGASLQAVAAGPDKVAAVDQIDSATIVQAQGVDQSVDYASLRRFGPWDDRNYALTQADIAVLPADDEYRHGVPAFFKIEKRREMAAEGYPIEDHYPRELDKDFLIRYGGLLQDGVLHRRGLGVYYHPDPANPPPPLMYTSDPIVKALAVPVNGETAMAIGNNETSIKYNPIDPMIVIAGSNGSGGQSQNYSTDGGVTWFSAGVLPSTCCDPAMEWSADGTVAYAATLPNSGGLRAGLFRSTDFGQTWGSVILVSSGSSDKEWIHVDTSPTSPYLENVYLTWHQGNVMFFSRSTDKGLTWSTPISFSSAPRGIGSDITTDSAGNIYYIWPSSQAATANIYMVKSTDGGLTFGAPVIVQPLFDTFDFPIPSMESRRAFIYIAAEADRTGGPNDGRIYAAYTALHPSSGGTTATNHAWVQIAYSDDGGATWGLTTTPHSEADIATVDRYHPWLELDASGALHLGFYDTRNSPGRTGVDFYYNYSIDGGTTWVDETRVSATTSINITNGQEWGDYNGITAGPVETAMSWTDNRPGGGGTPLQRSYVGRVQNLAAGPTYTMGSAGPSDIAVCAGDALPVRDLTLQGVSGYTGSAAITFPGLDPLAFASATATPNPVAVGAGPAVSTINMSTAPTAADGDYAVTVEASDGGMPAIVRTVGFSVGIASASPAMATLTSPAGNATDVGLNPTFTWGAVATAVSYEIEISSDAGFVTIVDTASVTDTSYTSATTLNPETLYFWRVRATNACGDGAYSTTSQFTTGFLICFTGPLPIPDNNTTGATGTVVVAANGTIGEFNLDVEITHTYPGDLELQLSNGTTSVTLGSRLGGTSCGVDNVDVTFDDQAAQAVTCGTTPPGISGNRQPASPLSVFNGSPLAASWSLKAIDRAGQDVGQIESFCLVPTLLPDIIYVDGFDLPTP
ncbi:proprotein convertase P-domain-containing protein [Dokdonella sp.]|uniref:proprotein convertase P-domain-containing protein n=1 Tax=Dokdonella sp. TaxID=2291710 RepID=UPI003C512F43